MYISYIILKTQLCKITKFIKNKRSFSWYQTTLISEMCILVLRKLQ